MPFNGSGTFNRTFPPGGWQGDAASAIKIRADRHDQHDTDLATGLSNAICRDGQSSISADIPFNDKKITGLGTPVNPTDAAHKGYVDTAINTVTAATDLKVAKAGDTMTGALTVNHASGITTSGPVTASQNFVSSTAAAVLAATGAGAVYLRPNGAAATAGQLYVDTNGHAAAAGRFIASGDATCWFGRFNVNDVAVSFNSLYTIRYLNSSLSMDFIINGGIRFTCRASDGFLVANHGGAKPGGGVWSDSSDARIKTVQGAYETGLEAIRSLNPVRYTFKGNDTSDPPAYTGLEADAPAKEVPDVPYPNSPHYHAATEGNVYTGLIAQEVEAVLPGVVTRKAGYIDGVAVDDLRDLDTSELIFTLVNAVKELAARVEALEAAS